MYQDHFGFYTAPFSLAPSLKFLYASQAFEETMAHLVYGLEGGEDFVLITGETGAGKTLALNNLTAHLSGAYRVALVNVTQVNFTELLKMLLGELGCEVPPDADRADLLLILKREVEAARREGRRLLLVVDEAQNLDRETLEGLRLLVNLGPPEEQVIQVVLSGQPGLLLRLREPDLVQLRQRIRVHYHLAPLDRKEVGEYIRHRVRVAGCERDVFSAEAVDLIARHSGGVPRLVNILADKALLAAYVDGADVVKAKHVEIPEDLPRTTPEQRRIASLAAEAAEQITPRPPETAPAPPPVEAGEEDTVPPAGQQGGKKEAAPAAASGREPEREEAPAAGPAAEPADEPGPPRPPVPEEDVPTLMARRRARSRRGRWLAAAAIVVVAGAVFAWWRSRETDRQRAAPTVAAAADSAVREVSPETMVTAGAVTGTLSVHTAVAPAAPETTGGPATAEPAPSARDTSSSTPPAVAAAGSTIVAARADTVPVVPVPAAGKPAIRDSVDPGLYILVGSFRDEGRARQQARRVGALAVPVTLVRKQIRGTTWIRVLAGPWPDTPAAREGENTLRRGGVRDDLLLFRVR